MASLTQWTQVWASSGRWWGTGKPGVLLSMGSQRVGHEWVTKQQVSLLSIISLLGYIWIYTNEIIWVGPLDRLRRGLVTRKTKWLEGWDFESHSMTSRERSWVWNCCCCSVAKSCPTLCDTMNPSMPGLPVHHRLLEFTQTMCIELMMPCNHLVLCHPLLLLSSIIPSIRVFSNELALRIWWAKYWSFSISPSNEYSGLISFRIDRFDLCYPRDSQESSLAPQFKSINSSVLSILCGWALHLYMTIGKTIILTIWTFVGKMMSLLFNMVSRLFIALLPRNIFYFHSYSHKINNK